VLQKLPASLEQTPNPNRTDVHSCTLRFWPALLK
jgi:hypothetical protein